MSDLRKAAEAVLEAWAWDWSEPRNETLKERMEALRQALEEQPEPIAWMVYSLDGQSWGITDNPMSFSENQRALPLWAGPFEREWVGLTDAEVEAWRGNYDFFDSALVREVEAKLKEKNT